MDRRIAVLLHNAVLSLESFVEQQGDCVFGEHVSQDLFGDMRFKGPHGVVARRLATAAISVLGLLTPGRRLGVMLFHSAVKVGARPPIADLLPISVAPNPPLVSPPTR